MMYDFFTKHYYTRYNIILITVIAFRDFRLNFEWWYNIYCIHLDRTSYSFLIFCHPKATYFYRVHTVEDRDNFLGLWSAEFGLTYSLITMTLFSTYVLSSHNMSTRKGWLSPCRLFLKMMAIMAWTQTTAVSLKVNRKREYHCITGLCRRCYQTSIIICDGKIKKLKMIWRDLVVRLGIFEIWRAGERFYWLKRC